MTAFDQTSGPVSDRLARESEILAYLDLLTRASRGQHMVSRFVLAQGLFFPAAPRPPQITKMPNRACFSNALQLVLRHPELTYVEGYGANMVVTEHAWCVTPDGVVVDPTWAEPQQCAYLGVPFQTSYVLEVVSESESAGLLTYENRGLVSAPPSTYRQQLPGFARCLTAEQLRRQVAGESS